MTQQGTAEHARAYVSHQASKGLESLAALTERTRSDWTQCLEGITENQATFAPSGEWSSKEVLAHFIPSSHEVNRRVAELAKGEDFAATFDTDWTDDLNEESERERPLSELRTHIGLLFDDTQRLVNELDASDSLHETFKHPMFGDLNLTEWIAFQRLHSMDHIQQIDKIKADPEYPAE